MQVAELADHRHLSRDSRLGRARDGHTAAQIQQWQYPRVEVAQPQRQTTGFEPFLIAALLGLGLWALILTPIFL